MRAVGKRAYPPWDPFFELGNLERELWQKKAPLEAIKVAIIFLFISGVDGGGWWYIHALLPCIHLGSDKVTRTRLDPNHLFFRYTSALHMCVC
jgi:hypothetical protein